MEFKIPILSFFSGGGFMDMGFEEAGFKVVWTNEIDPDFAKFYGEGFTNWKNNNGIQGEFAIVNCNSIKDIKNETIISEAFNGSKPELFGIIGGPPCQDFSINGNLNGFKGDKGSLTDCFLLKIIELRPSFFVMENVTGLLKVQKNAKHFFDLLDVMREYFHIDFKVLNSLDYGVPQWRERVFVIGIKKEQFDIINFPSDCRCSPFPEEGPYFNSANKYKWPSATAFGKFPVKDEEIPLELCVESCLVPDSEVHLFSNANEYFNLLGDKRVLSGIKEGETNRPSFKRLHRYRYSPTTCYGNNEVHLHPYKHRRLSVREALRIQGVSDSYMLPVGSLTKKFKMIGNGVPVPLAREVAAAVLKFIRNLPIKAGDNGLVVKKEEKRSHVKNPVKEYKAGNIAKVVSA